MNRLFFQGILLIAAQLIISNHLIAFDFDKEQVIDRLKEDVYTLAGDDMEGREAGTEGERKAVAYIKQKMQEAGLAPLFDGSFYQEFPFPGEWVWGPENEFIYQDSTFEHETDYYIIPGSPSVSISAPFAHMGYGLTGMEEIEGFEEFADYCDYALHDDLDGHILLMEFFTPARLDTLTDRQVFRLWFSKINNATARGAKAIIFVNTDEDRDDPPIDMRMSRMNFDIPLLFAHDNVLHALMSDQGGTIYLTVDAYREDHTAVNVAGYIDNEAETTVVIGAHHDHVGWGGQGSMSPGVYAIHPGADDNASGVAGMLEAARYIQQQGWQNHNYLFIGFGAEERGLLGSRYFTQSDAYDMDRVMYMFNLDMIGRMEDETLTLIGTGSSPDWDYLIDTYAPDHFNIRKSPGGRGGSDHTSFYVMDIPVLFFFTGVHEDYHRPGDTPEKINYTGAYEITRFALDMAEALEGRDQLAFSSTAARDSDRRRSRGVTLGLMPDHGYDGEGLRVLSVTEDRPAARAGIVDGDVIVRINGNPVVEIQTYMDALEGLDEGDTARVVVIRGDEEHKVEVSL